MSSGKTYLSSRRVPSFLRRDRVFENPFHVAAKTSCTAYADVTSTPAFMYSSACICTQAAISSRVHMRATGDHVHPCARRGRGRRRERRSGSRRDATSVSLVHVYTYIHAYICIRTCTHTCMCMCTRISRNTRSSNPLLETRLIPRIAICL